ncbi:GrpB family protein [Xenorhabdus sp. DI]|uniref:GrpB family protein n=1 Tax=Xenorhabdus doucetiae TaxID=351671 RepID=UPI0019A7E586|nr:MULTISPECIES: GrpB family protein [unclassified Xenorhabdus]MBD2786038.1 GrpB family protein [Xenorhabdus sp. 3]MBD2786905.1 GrpB family protein [Xenorhabdus sp. DI]
MSDKLVSLKPLIMSFCEGDPNENPWVNGIKRTPEPIIIVPYDTQWGNIYNEEKNKIQKQLQEKIISIVHIGSTAVPGLPAKPIIDIDLIVADPSQEIDYIPALEKLGYALRIREPSWYQHRMLRLDSPRVNLHIFGEHCPEYIRHLLFRNWLRNHENDRQRYEIAKLAAIEGAVHVMDYNNNKNQVIKGIYEKIFNNIDKCLSELDISHHA